MRLSSTWTHAILIGTYCGCIVDAKELSTIFQQFYLIKIPFFVYRHVGSYQFRHHSVKIFDDSLQEYANTFDYGTKVVLNGRIDPSIVDTIDGKKKCILSIRANLLMAYQK